VATAVEYMRADAESALRDAGRGAVTINYAGTDIVCRVVYGRRRDRDRKDRTMARVCWIRVAKADIALPQYQDRVVIGSETWLMAEIEKETAWDWRLRLETSRRQGWR